MPNNYFSFQKFTVKQEYCAMKVTTEASLFGAWVAHQLNGKEGKALDIGTGTGLLSLIVAQETRLEIDAIEIDAVSAAQAKENFGLSTFSERLRVINQGLQSFESYEKYDYLFSNPPFYENDLYSPHPGKQIAHHGESLKLSDLCKKMNDLLTENGAFFILFPEHRKEELIECLMKAGLFVNNLLHVYHNSNEKSFRIYVQGSRVKGMTLEEKMVIREGTEYSVDFRKLLLPYYLPQALQQNQKDIRSGE